MENTNASKDEMTNYLNKKEPQRSLAKPEPTQPEIVDGRMVFDQPYDCGSGV